MKMTKPTHLDLLIQFTTALRRLPPTQKRSLRTWLRHRLKAKTNGHPARTFYIINPTGGLDPL